LIDLQPHCEGTVLPVRANAGARKNGIAGLHGGMLRVSVTEAPEKGKANKAIASLLAKTLGFRKSQIELIAGQTNPQKRFLVRDVSPDDLRAKIESTM